MSKRQRGHQTTASRPQAKRSRLGISIGAPSADDRRFPSENNPSSSALSTRVVKQRRAPALAGLCIRIFTEHFAEFSDEEHWESTRTWLKILPDSVLPNLFSALKAQHPRRLNHAVITTYFLRGTSVSLNGELAIASHTLTAIPRVLGSKLLVLELSDIDKYTDSTYATMVKDLPLLKTLVLRNCPKVGPSTAEMIANNCRHLKKLNLNFTSVTAMSLLTLFKSIPDLEVLKLAGIQNLSDATIARLFSLLTDDGDQASRAPLRNLKTLKLRHNTISEIAIAPFLQRCTHLERLDVSFTLLKHIPDLPAAPFIEKISLTSTFLPGKELVELINHLPHLKVLNAGAMGVKAATTSALSTSTAMTLSDDILRHLTDAMQGCPMVQSLNLVQNTKLGTLRGHNSAIVYFIQHIGRKLSYLNLSGVSVRSEDLLGLVPENQGEEISPLETLILNKSLIDDECAHWISSCKLLEVLEVAETRISEDGLLPIIDSCTRLAKLNLTGCRGVRIVDRRRFFEVWEERRMANT
ncbi:hypothetical protein ACEPAI_364 [Sanghuangporus weigelae]